MVAEVTATLEERAELHAVLGDPHRLHVVDLLRWGDRTSGELAAATRLPTNLLAHHLGVLERAGLVSRHRSCADARRRYVRLEAQALEKVLPPAPTLTVPGVLFVCTHNSGRSPLAAALWNARSPVPARSAGTEPAGAFAPGARREAGRRHLELVGSPASVPASTDELVVTVCDRARELLAVTGALSLHWSIPDPAETGTGRAYRDAADELARRVAMLVPRVRRHRTKEPA